MVKLRAVKIKALPDESDLKDPRLWLQNQPSPPPELRKCKTSFYPAYKQLGHNKLMSCRPVVEKTGEEFGIDGREVELEDRLVQQLLHRLVRILLRRSDTHFIACFISSFSGIMVISVPLFRINHSILCCRTNLPIF